MCVWMNVCLCGPAPDIPVQPPTLQTERIPLQVSRSWSIYSSRLDLMDLPWGARCSERSGCQVYAPSWPSRNFATARCVYGWMYVCMAAVCVCAGGRRKCGVCVCAGGRRCLIRRPQQLQRRGPLLAFLECTDHNTVSDHIRLHTSVPHLPQQLQRRGPLLAFSHALSTAL
jgi:hypothetical protein